MVGRRAEKKMKIPMVDGIGGGGGRRVEIEDGMWKAMEMIMQIRRDNEQSTIIAIVRKK